MTDCAQAQLSRISKLFREDPGPHSSLGGEGRGLREGKRRVGREALPQTKIYQYTTMWKYICTSDHVSLSVYVRTCTTQIISKNYCNSTKQCTIYLCFDLPEKVVTWTDIWFLTPVTCPRRDSTSKK